MERNYFHFETQFKSHVLTANGRFKLRIFQNRKLAAKTVQNNWYRQNLHEATNLGADVMNSKEKGKTWSRGTLKFMFVVCRSLRSKRCHLVSEQRKTGFGRARDETRAKQ